MILFHFWYKPWNKAMLPKILVSGNVLVNPKPNCNIHLCIGFCSSSSEQPLDSRHASEWDSYLAHRCLVWIHYFRGVTPLGWNSVSWSKSYIYLLPTGNNWLSLNWASLQEFGSLPKYLSDQAAKMGNPGQTKTQADFNRTNFETILAWDWYLPAGL